VETQLGSKDLGTRSLVTLLVLLSQNFDLPVDAPKESLLVLLDTLGESVSVHDGFENVKLDKDVLMVLANL
jgi:hypothetical protein